ncbi:MAG: hypothetical protein HYR56_01745 [Acidobacteria bacterium]|nr:hypothetical protein [Acidobacteriota bacterium]MBI3424527.1 hypothetical protein [Acidobacteriota bacterium]
MNITRRWFILLFLFTLLPPTHAQDAAANAARERFDEAINAFLAADKTNPPPKGAILFIGSSIFRQWAKLQEHMAPLPVFNRAFGGSQTSDILYHMDKVVLPYEPKVIVYYCGSNDINANHKAQAIADRFRQFVTRVRVRLPQTRILFVSINRAPQKEDKWPVVDAANTLIKAYCESDKRLGFIDVNPVLFKDGKPRLELYQPDKLHFLEPAYEEFAAIIKPVVTKTWAQVGTGTK